MRYSDLTHAQKILIRDADPVSLTVSAHPQFKATYVRAAKAGLLKKRHGIIYELTPTAVLYRKRILQEASTISRDAAQPATALQATAAAQAGSEA